MSFCQSALQAVIQKYSKNFGTSAVVRMSDLSIVEPGDEASLSLIAQQSESDSESSSSSSNSDFVQPDPDRHLDRVLPGLFSSALSKSDGFLNWLLSNSLSVDDDSGKGPLPSSSMSKRKNKVSARQTRPQSESSNTEHTSTTEDALTVWEEAVTRWERRNRIPSRTSSSSSATTSCPPPRCAFSAPKNKLVHANTVPVMGQLSREPHTGPAAVQTFQPEYYPSAPMTPMCAPVQAIQPQYNYGSYVTVPSPARPVYEKSPVVNNSWMSTPRNTPVDTYGVPAVNPFSSDPYMGRNAMQTFQTEYYAPMTSVHAPLQPIQPQCNYASYMTIPSPARPVYESHPVVEGSLLNFCRSVEQWEKRAKQRSEKSLVSRSVQFSNNPVSPRRPKRHSAVEPYSRRTGTRVPDDFSEDAPDDLYGPRRLKRHSSVEPYSRRTGKRVPDDCSEDAPEDLYASSRRPTSRNKENTPPVDTVCPTERVVRWLHYQQTFQS